jgi:putative acetyltransferase
MRYITDQLPSFDEARPGLPSNVCCPRIVVGDNELRVIAEIGGAVVGLGVLDVAKEELRACYVAPGAIRKGVGTALVRELERWARASGLARLPLNAALSAEPFYRAQGYRTRRRGEHILCGQTMACVKMDKELCGRAGERGS